MAAFEELGVMPEITEALQKMDWNLPTEIQSEAIPLILGGGDVLMASETGTGKTGAFCIPIVQVVYEQILESRKDPAKRSSATNDEAATWTLSALDRGPDLVLGHDLITAQSKSGNWQGCRTNKGIKRSRARPDLNCRVYYEVHFDEQGLARVGWSFSDASLDLGTDPFGYGYGGAGKKSNRRQFTDYGLTYGEKFDIIGCILDLNTCELSFTKNGRNLGVAFKISPQQLESREIYPSICVKNAGCRARFGPGKEKNDHKPGNCVWISEVSESLVVAKKNVSQKNANDHAPLAIILEPSRELAKQTYDCVQTFSKGLGINTTLWIGGVEDSKQLDERVHIIVCTPGRLSGALSKQQIPLHNIHFFILDEADGLLQQGQQRLIKSVHAQLPKMFNTGRRLQTVCCSATLHNFEVKKLAQQLMYFPTWIDLKGEDSVPETVHHVVLRLNPREDKIYQDLKGLFQTDGVHKKDSVCPAIFNQNTLSRPEEVSEAIKLMKFYYTVKAIDTLKMDQGIIFCRTKLDCDNLEEFMNYMNKQTKSDKFSCVRLHSSLSQRDRVGNLEDFKIKKVKFLICTDVAARGIDVRGIPFVIQVTLPDEKANYIHRIGRVGRAERMGLAISLVGTEPEKVWYHGCNKRECYNTRLVEKGGCCKWFDELSILADVEDHLKCTIQEIGIDLKLHIDEYDGKVVYGAKRLGQTLTYEGHVEQLKSLVNSLSELESKAQTNYIKLYM